MPSTWQNHTATLLANGQVLVAGGYSNDILAPSAALYDPAGNTWSLTGSMSQFHIHHTATLLMNGKVLVAGNDIYPAPGSTAELYDPGTKTWSVVGSMALKAHKIDQPGRKRPPFWFCTFGEVPQLGLSACGAGELLAVRTKGQRRIVRKQTLGHVEHVI